MDNAKSVTEREKIIKRLDKDLEEFIESRPKTEYKDGFSENNWEEEMELHPAFRTKSIEEGEELPPLVEAMRQLKYDPDENTPLELARNYKEDGNYNFKLKAYRKAIIAYTEGIKQNCSDDELNAQLYTNRAVSNYYLGNIRSCITDCKNAIKYKNDHMKAILKAAKCCEELKSVEEGLCWCEIGLKVDEKNEGLFKIKSALEKQKKLMERDNRKIRLKDSKLKKEEESLLKAIKDRGINTGENMSITLDSLEPCHPMAVSSKVHLDENGDLVWPVLFLYPEYGQTDFIQEFFENDSFGSHLEIMFGLSQTERPPWDLNRAYIPSEIQLQFEDKIGNVLWNIDTKHTLKDVLKHRSFIVMAGTPAFIITVKSSVYHQQFLKNYDQIKAF